jgi:hypothetical protein
LANELIETLPSNNTLACGIDIDAMFVVGFLLDTFRSEYDTGQNINYQKSLGRQPG